MKKALAFILVLASAAALAACGGGKVEPKQTEAAVQPTVEASSGIVLIPPEEGFHDPYEDYNNRFWDVESFAETEDTIFFGQMYYYKPTGETGVFCALPDCTHKSRDCQASGWMLGGYDGKLYCFFGFGANERWLTVQNPDGSDKKRVMQLLFDDNGIDEINGKQCFHRGKLYMLYGYGAVEDAVPYNALRITRVDPKIKEAKVLYERKYGGDSGWSALFKGKYLFVLFSNEKYDEESDRKLGTSWELYRMDLETEEMELILQNDDNIGFITKWWMDDDQNVYALVDRSFIAKLVDGRFEKQWTVDKIEGMDSWSMLSDGYVISCYFEGMYGMDLFVWIKDINGRTVIKQKLPIPKKIFEDGDLIFDELQFLWTDGETLWIEIFMNDSTPDPESRARPIYVVRYDIADGEFYPTMAERMHY